MSAIKLAKLLCVGTPRMARIELTDLEPRANTVRKLAKALNVSADYLLELDDTPRRLGTAKLKPHKPHDRQPDRDKCGKSYNPILERDME